ncbi:hypothetical protein COLO4_37030 [Corchorus olitorius]|uniref:Uncharacterized protein n=1 Tax=Corchorus olitorius TaxID=93759 RepID=A0A1R3G3S3_9ROSI|nr:hypothetical protein COLO4_37029 [Corchorus olitorius]OMO52720.1 hypothetical protein COLO4_37030 [Corchorus olitorius]
MKGCWFGSMEQLTFLGSERENERERGYEEILES